MENWLKWFGLNDGVDQSKTQHYNSQYHESMNRMGPYEAVACTSGKRFKTDIIFPKFKYEFEKP